MNSIAPNISAPVLHVDVLSGSNVTLRCVLHKPGVPRATIQWTFNDSIITNDTLYLITENSTRLDINGINLSRAGPYHCNATKWTNIAGSSVATINIDVQGSFHYFEWIIVIYLIFYFRISKFHYYSTQQYISEIC